MLRGKLKQLGLLLDSYDIAEPYLYVILHKFTNGLIVEAFDPCFQGRHQ